MVNSYLKTIEDSASRSAVGLLFDAVSDFLRRPRATQSVRLEPFIEQEEGEPDCLEVHLVVNGQILAVSDHGPIDLFEVERSLKSDSVCFIWTCWCGYPGCAGYDKGVRVTHRQEFVRWHCQDTQRRYYFELSQLREAFNAFRLEAQQLVVEKDLAIGIDQNVPYLRPDVSA